MAPVIAGQQQIFAAPALVAELINDAKGSDTLPQLANAGAAYTKYSGTGQLTLANYDSKSIGGIREWSTTRSTAPAVAKTRWPQPSGNGGVF